MFTPMYLNRPVMAMVDGVRRDPINHGNIKFLMSLLTFFEGGGGWLKTISLGAPCQQQMILLILKSATAVFISKEKSCCHCTPFYLIKPMFVGPYATVFNNLQDKVVSVIGVD